MYRSSPDIISNAPDIARHLIALPTELRKLVDAIVADVPTLRRDRYTNLKIATSIWFTYSFDNDRPMFVVVAGNGVMAGLALPIFNNREGTILVRIYLGQEWLERRFNANPAIHEAMSQLVVPKDQINDVQSMPLETRAKWRQAIAELLRNLGQRK